METVHLAANTREPRGSKLARAIRRAGKVPAILYGHGMKPVSLEVETRELQRALHTKAGENVLITLKVQGANLKDSTCLIKDIQHNPVTDEIQHVDFTVISLTEKIEVKVPLVVKHADEALGIKEGGILDVVHHEIEVECLPTQIPEKVEVDLKDMKIGDAIHAKDLSLPKGVEIKYSPEEVIVAVHAPKKEVTPAPEEEVTQPEVIEKGKKLEVEEGAEAKPAAPKAAAGKTEKKE
jgi:large subunit ribosomal protein L25